MAYSMNSRFVQVVRECVAALAFVGLLATGAVAEEMKKEPAAETAKEPAAVSGTVEFDCPGLPEANIEFNLSQGMFKDLFGIGDAAITGVVQGLAKATGAEAAEEQATAEQLKSAHQMLELVGQVVQGFRLHLYEDEKSVSIKDVAAHYSKKLAAQNWETVLRVREDDELYVVNVLRSGGAIKGVFVIWYDGHDAALMNAVCDVSPENMRKLTSSAAALGVKVGMEQKPSLAALNFLWSSESAASAPPAPVGDK